MMKGLTIAMIFSYESVSQLQRCVDSLKSEISLLPLPESEIEWILIRTPKAQGKDISFFPGSIHFSSTENLGFNRRWALEESRHAAFYFIDPDCWLPRGSLLRLVEKWNEHWKDPSLFAFAGPNLFRSNHPLLNPFMGWLGKTRFLHGGLSQIENPENLRRDWHSPTCHILYRKNLLNENFDSSSFPIVGEDLEFHFRLSQKGRSILICPQAPIWHEQASDLKTYFRKVFRYGTAQTRLLKAQPKSFRNKRLLLVVTFLLWISTWLCLPSSWQSAWLLASCLATSLLVFFELLFFKGEKEIFSFFALYAMTLGVYLSGQLAGILIPRSKMQNADSKVAKIGNSSALDTNL